MAKQPTKNKKEHEKVDPWIPGYKILNEFYEAEEILKKEVVSIGTGACVRVPKKHLGKTCRVIIPQDQKGEGEGKK